PLMRTLACSALSFALIASGTAHADALADCNAQSLTRVLSAEAQPAPAASAIWLDAAHLRWPQGSANGRFSLHFSPDGQLQARTGAAVSGAAASTPLQVHDEALGESIEARFRWFGPGVTLRLPASMSGKIAGWHRGQLL